MFQNPRPYFEPVKRLNYLSINSVRTNGPTLCPNVLLPYAPEYVEKPLRDRHMALFVYKRFFNIFGSVSEPYIRA